jgi:His-Xaa-Ser system protein HxsD
MKNFLIFKIDASIYSEEIISKATYSLNKKYVIEIRKLVSFFKIIIGKEDRKPFKLSESKKLEHALFKSLNDFKTRVLIHNQTKNLRDLIIMKALFHFSEEDINFKEILND